MARTALPLMTLAVAATAPEQTRRSALPPEEVVRRLDAHYHAIMQDFELTLPKRVRVKRSDGKWVWVERGRFGMDRLTPFIPGHGQLGAEAPNKEVQRATMAALVGWREWIFLVGNGTAPLTADNARSMTSQMWGAILPGIKQYPTDAGAVDLAQSLLKKPKFSVVSAKRNGFHWAASRIVFKDTRCLGCHRGSKLGDTAGVLVYALHADSSRKDAPRIVKM